MQDLRAGRPSRLELSAVALLAGATLGLQVVLTRHFSFLYWHHFAFMIIGVGMLGFGAAGAWLARRGGVAGAAEARALAARAAGVAAASLLAYLSFGPALRFEPLHVLSEPANLVVLFALYAAIGVPFTALGLAQGALLAGYREHADRVYAADLFGAGAGCLATLALLAVLSAPAALLAAAAIVALAGTSLAAPGNAWRGGCAVAGVAALVLLTLGWADARPFRPASSKDLGGGVTIDGRLHAVTPFVEYTASSSTLRLDVTKPLTMPFVFGADVAGPPGERVVPARVVFQDGAAPTYLYSIPAPDEATFLGRTTQGFAYQIRRRPQVLVIGAGGGPDVLVALHHGARSVTAVELDPQMLALGRERYADFLNDLYHRPEVNPIVSEGRHFLGRTRDRFDVIQMSGVDTFAALAAGAYAMSENYLYTVEAGVAMLETLRPDGVLTISRWRMEPPRETLRLVNVLRASLVADGVGEPGRHLFVVRGGAWETTLVSRRPFLPGEVETLRGYAEANGFEVVLAPDGTGNHPYRVFVHGSEAERRTALASYPYDVTPVGDDAPFFFDYYRWSRLFDGGPTRGGYVITQIPVGHAVLAASLLQMALLAAIFILGPLWSRRSQLRDTPRSGALLAWFAALGLGFMTIEISSIQGFTVFLGHPIYSMAITLTALLLATGLGAWISRWLPGRPETVVAGALLVVTAWVTLSAGFSGVVIEALLPAPLWARAAIVAAWLLPVGVALGIPFPTSLRSLEAKRPALVPWAWGINGCFSVIASMASVLVAMQLGFRTTQALAVVLYWVGWLAWRPTVRSGRAGVA